MSVNKYFEQAVRCAIEECPTFKKIGISEYSVKAIEIVDTTDVTVEFRVVITYDINKIPLNVLVYNLFIETRFGCAVALFQGYAVEDGDRITNVSVASDSFPLDEATAWLKSVFGCA